MHDQIIVKGARVNNLKNVDITIPRDKLVVFTGLSGSGKSSLAFDTIYAEGQRRYIESMSSYARLFLGQADKPDVDSIDGLSPVISIDQKTTSHNPRSTVGTVTEIYDYLRLLFARVGHPHCPVCGREVRRQSVDEMVDALMRMGEGARLVLLAPVVRGKKGEYDKLMQDAMRSGFVRVRVDGETYELDDVPKLNKQQKHNIELVVDRVAVREEARQRITDSVETAMKESGGLVLALNHDTGEETLFSQNYACPECGVNLPELTPRLFSFNNPMGACPACDGLGTQMKVSEGLVVPDGTRSLREGAVACTGWNSGEVGSIAYQTFEALAAHLHFSLDTPFDELPAEVRKVIFYGLGNEKIKVTYESATGHGVYMTTYEGVIPSLERRYRETTSDTMKAAYQEYMSEEACPVCRGKRLKPEALAVTVGNSSIADVCDLNVSRARDFLNAVSMTDTERMIADQIIREINNRLTFLNDVGLRYLTLSRAAATLSGGEAQRIRLATQIGSGLVGVLYVLDEPSIGLHQRDNQKLLRTLRNLRDLGNTLIVVEHDEETLRAADYLVDIGPGAGEHGGEIVAQGAVRDLMAAPRSVTGMYLSGRRVIPVPDRRRSPKGFLTVYGAREHNLKNIDVRFPLGVFCAVTGVSGSGKSSLVNAILYRALAHDLNRARLIPTGYRRMEGVEQLDKIICIDQSPIGRSPRSNPATYTGLFDLIRRVFAQCPEAKVRGYKENRFSFNVKGGRCENCFGDGLMKIEMHFLPDIYVPCEVCKGKRYNRETLEVRYRGKTISDVLEMTVEEAMGVFENHQPIMTKLRTLYDVGLGYIRLGQPSTTLSGGEAQRVKLATELSRKATGKTLILLDEPTTGLHMDDVNRLISVLQRLTDAGNTVLVIEHNLDVIKSADWLIDLGPEGGDEGGSVIAEGTPEQVAQVEESYTGQFLREILADRRTDTEKVQDVTPKLPEDSKV
ncbi:MAG: excinuclease ABC subunit UvrA [Clostridia bacterium]|nr:excinuclease ABC subunit UvrA [Clostridia bacterium]